jgi:Trk K+ transport system NAD-binding subunit
MPAPSPSRGRLPSSDALFLALRRMRAPFIVLIAIFSVSVLGLTLIPGSSPDGPWRLGFFDAFYVMSYTATTIGYGEIPQAFNDAQRMWLTFSIYLTVVGWAYAIGTMLGLLRDRAFRQALAAQRFQGRVRRLADPFWLMAGHGQTGELLGRWLDGLGLRFVVLDVVEERIDVLDLGAYTADVPARAADARDPDVLAQAGLLSPRCVGVLALTDDDEANLAIAMSASVLRPDVPVIARASSAGIADRMRAFGDPVVIDPFDRFGDHLAVALRAPATEQLADWLTRAPGAPLPDRPATLRRGPWIVCGYGRFGRELVRDLTRDGLDVTVVDARPASTGRPVDEPDGVRLLARDAMEPGVLGLAGLERAVGFVAATDNDVTNLSLVATARAAAPDAFVVARQNQPVNADLFAALDVDLLMVPSWVVAQEALAHIEVPLLWEFLQEASGRDDAWSAALLDRLVDRGGTGSPELWRVELTPEDAPAVARRLGSHRVLLGDLLRDPQDRSQVLAAVVLLIAQPEGSLLAPAGDVELHLGDRLLLAGRASARRAMETTLELDGAAAYVLTGETLASSWVWRRLARSTGRA